ncbi:hypothetical protein K503DRAFT_775563 [Rhizopogon vinicolor AM-OR11-026]|uniref:Uncharacterized protein n=1 Tax=Rhizopogon vinicolor AM-OR11-026 TaxID=1314800 RepID=A0A1B7MLJ7_9AGAM|nr:hypothetical protein K503DRAFT_775563 [Rhizopogon vinicolor AM-OR11-026]
MARATRWIGSQLISFLELELRINAAVDILSVSTAQHDQHSLQANMNALSRELLLQKQNVKTLLLTDKGMAHLR